MKKWLKYILVVLFAYLIGLVVFLPDQYVEKWVLAKNANRLEWTNFSVHWGRFHLENVRLAGQPKLQNLVFSRVVVSPLYSRLLLGRKTADINILSGFGELKARVNVGQGDTLDVDFDADIPDINTLLAASGNPEHVELHGRASITGSAKLDLAAGKVLDTAWQAEMSELNGYDIRLTHATADGRMEMDLMKVLLAANGDLAVSGTLSAVPILFDPAATGISGTLEISPGEPKAGSLAATLFSDGKAKRLQITGVVGNPQIVLLPH
jgi:hypothetical protein